MFCDIEYVYSIITCYSIFTKYKILELARPKKKKKVDQINQKVSY